MFGAGLSSKGPLATHQITFRAETDFTALPNALPIIS
jgi:hypothetical protein